jgi:hypothetical protein
MAAEGAGFKARMTASAAGEGATPSLYCHCRLSRSGEHMSVRSAAPDGAMLGLAAASLLGAAIVTFESEAAAQTFASRDEAEAFLSRAVPAATAANPKYRSPDKDVATRWLLKGIDFRKGESGDVMVSTDEDIEDYRNDALVSRGTHQATFAMNDVMVFPETSSADTTESGQKAQGVIFRCAASTPCIDAVWNGRKSMGSETDIYLQDPTSREQILAAFQSLQRKSGSK